MISSYVGENAEFERQFLSGELEVELTPQVGIIGTSFLHNNYHIVSSVCHRINRKHRCILITYYFISQVYADYPGNTGREDQSGGCGSSRLFHSDRVRNPDTQGRESHQVQQ